MVRGTILFLIAISAAQADFALDFQPFVPGAGQRVENQLMECRFLDANSVGEACHRGETPLDPDPTPLYMETIVDADENMYYHVMIGDSNGDFSQEYYIRAGWGNWLGYTTYPKSASDGVMNGGIDGKPVGTELTSNSPLSEASISGNGTGAPHSIIFHQKIDVNGFDQVVLKANFDKKLHATQTVNDTEITSNFIVDMSAVGVFQSDTAGSITNTMVVTDSATGFVVTDFDMKEEAEWYTSNAQYSHSGGTGVNDLIWFYTTFDGKTQEEAEALAYAQAQGSSPSYTYAGDAEYDVYSIDWEVFRNADENVPDL